MLLTEHQGVVSEYIKDAKTIEKAGHTTMCIIKANTVLLGYFTA
jgi:hypothetical protein